MKKYFLYTVMLVFIGCKTDTKEPEAVEATAESVETVQFLRSIDNCAPESENCPYYLVTYPKFSGQFATQLNGFIDRIKSPAFDPDRRADPLENQAEEFLTGYTEYIKEYPGDSYVWYMSHVVSVVQEYEGYIILSGEISEYGGGAHPNYAIMYYNVDKTTGALITLQDLYSQEQIDMMSAILSVNINPEITLFSQTIYPNQNFILSADSITFVYNPYEIAPHSEGVIKLALPKDQNVNI